MAGVVRIAILADARNAVAGLRSVSGEAEKAGKSWSGMKNLVGGALAIGGVTGAVSVLKDSLDLAKQNAQAVRVFNSQLKNLGPDGAAAFAGADKFAQSFGVSIGKNSTEITKTMSILTSFPNAFK